MPPYSSTTEQEVRRRAEKYLDSCRVYSNSSYEREQELNDWIDKPRVAEKLMGDFEKRAGPLPGKSVLDIGFGGGFFSIAFARKGARVSGLEVNKVLADIAHEQVAQAGVEADLRLYDGHTFPYERESFDYCYSTSVLEHVDDAQTMLSEIGRVLKKGGACYLSFPNRLRPKETHTGIYFLSYLPRSVADRLMRTLFGRTTVEDINLHFISFLKLKRMLRKTPLVIKDESNGGSLPKRILKKALKLLSLHHSAILGTVMVVLEKKV